MTARPLVAVLDYGIGNLRSAQKALERVGADARLTADHDLIASADGVVLPGVGAFGRCVQALDTAELSDTAGDAARVAASGGRPFLGICIGMQLLYEASEEAPGSAGLGVLEGRVAGLRGDVKSPQMQWNRLESEPGHPFLAGLPEEVWVYFVHGYAAPIGAETVATCDYGERVCAAVARGNLWAAQFHPEKSGTTGLQVLHNFVDSLPGGSS